MREPLRVTFITRRPIAAAILMAVVIMVGIWQGVSHLRQTRPVLTDGPHPLTIDEPVRQVKDAHRQIALTVNVDWGNEVIPAMLDVFDEKNVTVTFFLTGRWARAYPEMAREIAHRGHEIGNHGLSHAHPTQLSSAALEEHIAGAVPVIREAAEVNPVPLYAPPYGEQDRRVVETAKRLGHWTTLWTLDTIDWQNPAPSTIIRRIVPRAADGAIVLMHPKPQTLEALPQMIDDLHARGYLLVPLFQMIQGAADP